MTDWVFACLSNDIEREGVKRFDIGSKTFALYRSAADEIFCTQGLCSHEAVHLADGMVVDYEIECPKHSGIFDIRSGQAKRLPACVDLITFATRVENGRIFIKVG